jgi:CRISPR-associated endonuclease/helicase Cas3
VIRFPKSEEFPVLPFSAYPAKTFQAEDGRTRPGRSVLEHCHIVGEVARTLIARYPTSLQSLLFPAGAPFAAAAHDVGKISPCFSEKLRRACVSETCTIPRLKVNPELELGWGGHAGVSQATAVALQAPQWVPEVLGQHHGFSPDLGSRDVTFEGFGGPAWQQQREALLAELQRRLGMTWPRIENVAQARVLAGLTSVADWIGSGQHFENPDLPWANRIAQAVHEAGLTAPTYRHDLSFEQIFGFSPRPAQPAGRLRTRSAHGRWQN